jgi:hypothetical protein
MPQAQVQSTQADNNKKHIVLGLVAAFLIYAVSFYYLQTMGVAMGALFFNLTLFTTIAPAILGSAMNIEYAKSLKATLPQSLDQIVDKQTMNSLGDPSVLLLKPAMRELQKRFDSMGNKGQAFFAETVQAIRTSLQSGSNIVFMTGAGPCCWPFLFLLFPRSQSMSRSKTKEFPNSSSLI